MQDTPSQKAAGSSARGAAETAGARAKAGSGASEAESGGAGSAAGGGGGSGGGSGGASTAPPMDDGTPTFTNLYNVVFWSCTNPSCHGGGLAGLNFATKDAAWATLVGKPANPMYECAKLGKQRVVPGEPDNSLLYLKLDINAPCGQQMPPGGSLSDAALKRVRDWIMNGAKND
ncbi:MAG TPA: hypothetical protein VJV78_35930 [Polyangiales bacterium]|nr:hypothetical protein [Polyangiales bacterium]